MELGNLKGAIIGVISNDFKALDYEDKLVADIVVNKTNDALKMVGLDSSILNKKYSDLASRDKNRVILASKLQDKEIILVNFTKGLVKKDLEYFKSIFKKIVKYGRKIILVDHNTEIFLNLVDTIYIIDKDKIIYDTTDIYDKTLMLYTDVPKIVDFTRICENNGIRIDHYQELDELLKAIYRIKS